MSLVWVWPDSRFFALSDFPVDLTDIFDSPGVTLGVGLESLPVVLVVLPLLHPLPCRCIGSQVCKIQHSVEAEVIEVDTIGSTELNQHSSLQGSTLVPSEEGSIRM